jgi:hypothetical protein
MLPVGQPIFPVTDFGHRVTSDAVDAEQAVAVVLQAYLRSLEFVQTGRAGPNRVQSRVFKLEDVFEEWPDPNLDMPYPCASLGAATATYQRHSLTPSPLPGSFGVYDEDGKARTALWKLSELVADFQVDTFANTVGDREATIARMPGAFAPAEDTDRVLLSGTPLYWCLPVRARLLEHQRIDEEDPMMANEWRARFVVRCTIEVVELRCANLLSVRSHLTAGEMIEVAETGA